MLFNKDNNGSTELYELSGIFQASTRFLSIAAEIDAATREVSAIVGRKLIASVEKIYAKNVPTPDEKVLLDMLRRPIAYLAIGMHAKLSGISHGETGRKNKVDDNEKIAFQWQIDRDDQELRERYIRSLDTLVSYLTFTGNAEWNASATAKLAAGSIVKDIAQLEAVYPIEHSWYTFYMLLPLIIEAQGSRITALVGESRMEALVAGTESEAIASPARRAAILRALITAAERWSLSVFPVAVARQFAPSYQGAKEKSAATMEEIKWSLGLLRKQLEDAERDVKIAVAEYSPSDRMFPDNRPENKFFTV